MAKVRVYELAKELGIPNKELIARLGEMGISVKSHSSSITDEDAARVRAAGTPAAGAGQASGEAAATPPATEGAATARATSTPPESADEPPASVDASNIIDLSPQRSKRKPKPRPPAPKPASDAPLQLPPRRKPAEAEPPAPKEPEVMSPAEARPTPPKEQKPPSGEPRRGAAPATKPPETRPEAGPAEEKRKPETPEPAPAETPEEAAPDGKAPAAAREESAGEAETSALEVEHGTTVQEFAELVGKSSADVVKALMDLGEMKTATQSMTDEEVELLSEEFGIEVELVSAAEAEAGVEAEIEAELAADENAEPRPPVVTVMGHVDHGKTSILDQIRKANVAAGEAGGITQHIGAYQVKTDGKPITFIDTPGHAAFTAMRARGASVTDIAVLVVAADDGVMPQTVEAVNHAKAAGVPIIVAVNKIDKPNADPSRVRQQLSEYELIPSEWGGDTEFVDLSAKEQLNIDGLLETIAVVAELEELKANPVVPARGVAIEAHLDKGRGAVASVIVRQGTLRRGDVIVCGRAYGRVRAMLDENGRPLDEASPAMPAQILGFQSVPQAGDEFKVVADERQARHVAEIRAQRDRRAELVATPQGLTLESLFDQVKAGEVAELVLVVKADVQGSLEALTDALGKLDTDEVKTKVIHRAVGGVNENDVRLAGASGGLVIGFNVRPDRQSRALAEEEGVEIRTYRVIYEAIDEIEKALKGLLAPEFEEIVLGQAEVRALFKVPRAGVVAGCMVTDGQITRNARVRVVRDGAVVFEGGLSSLKRFKEDVREVNQGYECGMGVENFQDVKEGDVIEAYEMREVPR
ncbi:MAG: translation initiation factor IF-2 [Acidimicrobiia bacterium]|nr:translation initiation factor IF-2 [Acidimicrobiia bacterium]